MYIQKAQFWKLAQGIWDGTCEAVQVEIQAHQISQVSNIIGDWPSYVIAVKLPVTDKNK